MRATVIPMVSGTLGTIFKKHGRRQGKIRGTIDTTETTAVLKSTIIL